MTQPEALRLADELTEPISGYPDPTDLESKAAAELRRLHEVNQQLLEALPKQLDAVIAWLENGCSPTEAAKELRILDDRIHAAIAEVKP